MSEILPTILAILGGVAALITIIEFFRRGAKRGKVRDGQIIEVVNRRRWPWVVVGLLIAGGFLIGAGVLKTYQIEAHGEEVLRKQALYYPAVRVYNESSQVGRVVYKYLGEDEWNEWREPIPPNDDELISLNSQDCWGSSIDIILLDEYDNVIDREGFLEIPWDPDESDPIWVAY